MLNYLEKFNNLPQETKNKISSPEKMKAVEELEKKYGINLATVIMRVVVGDISLLDLNEFFVFEHHIDGRKADDLIDELQEKVLFDVMDIPSEDMKPEVEKENKLGDWMQDREEEAAVRSSNFFFSPTDEEEVQLLAKKIEGYMKSSGVSNHITERVDKILTEIDVIFSSEGLMTRFKNVLGTYLRGVRSRVDTRQTLEKEIELGGLGLDADSVDRILLIADKINLEESQKKIMPAESAEVAAAPAKNNIGVEALKESGVRDVEYDFTSLKALGGKKKAAMTAKPKKPGLFKTMIGFGNKTEEKKEPPKTYNPIVLNSPNKASNVEVPEEKNMEKTPIAIEVKKAPIVEPKENYFKARPTEPRKTVQTEGRVKVEDVKYVPKLLGPVDELREIDVINLRRLSDDPTRAMEIIKDKIKFLEADSYSQRLAGIKAWRQSPVNRLYLQIGQESILSKQSIKNVIEKRKQENKSYLTNEEFDAVMDLNKSLRF